MAKHALLSASGAHRWLLCTPSAQLEQKFPASTSAYAEEGTVAHALAELTTRYFLGELDEVTYLDIESAIGGGLSGNLIYTERYL